MTPEAAAAHRLHEVEQELFARRAEHDIEPSLARIAALVNLLGDPHRACPVIHITGTNGKTSTARMIETLLRTRGLRTGLFTSPHLSSAGERIRIDGQPLAPEAFLAAYDDVAPYAAMVDRRQPFPLSFFEFLTGVAFAAFADAPVDVMVLEVGLGGAWDPTNVADGQVAVITPVAIDHTAYLGDTVEEIAGVKSGIIKPGSVVVMARQPAAAAEEVLAQRAAEVGAPVVREGLEFGVIGRDLAVGGQSLTLRGLGGVYHDLLLPLFGAYQASNSACALAAVEAFSGVGEGPVVPVGALTAGVPAQGPPAFPAGPGPLDEDLVREAFAAMSSPGRLEVVRRSPVVVVDAAHNPAGMAASLAALDEAFAFPTVVAVLAVSADKDVAGILGHLEPEVATLVVTRNSSARSMGPGELGSLAESVFGPDRVRVVAGLPDAIETAVALADEAAAGRGPAGAGVLVTGSVITAGDARVLLGADPPPPAGGATTATTEVS